MGTNALVTSGLIGAARKGQDQQLRVADFRIPGRLARLSPLAVVADGED